MNQQLFFKYNKIIASIIIIVLVLLIIQQIPEFITPKAPAPKQNMSDNVPVHPDLVKEIPSWHLFGVNTSQLPSTTLQLDLKGVFVSPIYPQAVISAPSSTGKLYKPGDYIPGNASLVKINPNDVILRHNGKLEKLSLIENKNIFSGPPPPLMMQQQ